MISCRRVGESSVPDPVHDFLPPGRVLLEKRAVDSLDLESGDPSDHGGPERVAELAEPCGELVSVMRAEELLRRSERSRVEAGPGPVRPLRHVRDHRVRVQVRLEVAVGLVAERGRHHGRRLHADVALRGPVPLPRHEKVLLDEAERRLHGPVVRPHDPRVARDQRRERDRLRGLQGDVHSRPVLALPVPDAPERDVRSRHRAGKDRLEAGRGDVAPEAERGRAAPVPAARLPVLRVGLRVVAVPLEVAGRDRGRGQGGEGGDHGDVRAFIGAILPIRQAPSYGGLSGLANRRTETLRGRIETVTGFGGSFRRDACMPSLTARECV